MKKLFFAILLICANLHAAKFSSDLNPHGIRVVKEIDASQMSKNQIDELIEAKLNDPYDLIPKQKLIKNFSFNLAPGESKIIELDTDFTTAFSSDSKICDYKVISSKEIIVFAKDSGYCEIKIFGKEPKELMSAIYVNVDIFAKELSKISKEIEKLNPGSKIKITKLNANINSRAKLKDSFVISGNVPNEKARDLAYNQAALSLGLATKTEKTKKTKTPGTSSSGKDLKDDNTDEFLMFLEKIKSERLIDNLKINLPNQVNVKLIVADVEKSVIDRLGLDHSQGIFKLDFLQNQRLGLKSFSLTSMLEAISNEKVAAILAKPNLSVLSGESASFQVVSQYTPISTTLNNSGYAVSSPGQPVDYGISLSIQPKILNRDKIILHISQEVSNIHSVVEGSGASSANLKKRRASSVVELADGQSFILAGLVDQSDTQADEGISGLKKVPVLGGLFKHVNNERRKSELLIIVTVNLENPIDNKYAAIPKIRIKPFMEQFFNIEQIEEAYKNEEIDFFTNCGFIK